MGRPLSIPRSLLRGRLFILKIELVGDAYAGEIEKHAQADVGMVE